MELKQKTIDIIGQFKRDEIDSSWIKFTNYPTLKLFYRPENNSSLFTFFGEKHVEAPRFNLLSMIGECQNFKNWVPMCPKSSIPHEKSHFRKTGSFEMKIPWPFNNRTVDVQISAMPSTGDEDAIIMLLRKIEGDKWLDEYPLEREEGKVECIINSCLVHIESISENH